MVPDAFLCSITGELMADPVSTVDGFSYEREAIMEWFELGHQTSPLTGAPLARADLLPNHALRAAIQQYVNEHPEAAEDLHRPRDTSSLRKVICAKQWAEPQVADRGDSHAGASEQPASVPMVDAVPVGLPVGPVQPPPPRPLRGLTADERAAVAAHSVSDWAVACAPRKIVSTGWQAYLGLGRKETIAPPAVDEPRMRVARPTEGPGIALEAVVSSDASMLRLAQRLAATSAAAPLAALRLTAADGYGPGTPAEISASSEGFELLTRSLMASEADAGCLGELRELSISKITIGDGPAGQLSSALSGHAALSSLELWNVGLEDEGAMSIAQLATADGNSALSQFNLGRNLISGPCKEKLEEIIDATRVHAKMY